MDVKSGNRIKIMLLKIIEKVQNKVIRILRLKGPRAEASNLYKESKYTYLNR